MPRTRRNHPSTSPLSSQDQVPSPARLLLGRWFTAARRDGLLQALDAPAWKTLAAVLSFTGKDGRRRFALDQLALVLGLSRTAAGEALAQLETVRWRELPLLTPVRTPQGELTGAEVAPLEDLVPASPLEAPATGEAPTHSHERAAAPVGATPHVARPIPHPTASPLEAPLLRLGLDRPQLERLLRDFPAPRIERQLAWLPHRSPRNPAAMLIRAVQDDWEAPRDLPPDFELPVVDDQASESAASSQQLPETR